MPIYNSEREIEELQAALDAKSPVTHTHAIALITGLQAALDAKSPVTHAHAIALITGLQAALDAKSPTDHTHAIALITGLQAALDAKSPADHTHAIAIIQGLQAALDAKAAVSHNHLPETWQDIPLSSGWSNYGSGFTVPQCRKLPGNLIEVKGTVTKSSSVVNNETIATLPVGYRPADTRFFIGWSSNGYSRLQVESSGAIKISISGSNPNAGLNFLFGLG